MLPGVVTHYAVVGMNIFVVPAVSSLGVRTVNLNESLIDFITQRVNHQKILPLCEGSKRRWKYDHGRARMSIYQQFHLTSDRWAIPSMILFVHPAFTSFIGISASLTDLWSEAKVSTGFDGTPIVPVLPVFSGRIRADAGFFHRIRF